jgi:hypothetical protein
VDPDFEAIRREHQAALDAVLRLQRACAEEFGDRAEAAGDFISFFEASLEPLQDERPRSPAARSPA